jgi:hypothetical protein
MRNNIVSLILVSSDVTDMVVDGWRTVGGRMAAETQELFGTTGIPTEFTGQAGPETVLAEIPKLNPGSWGSPGRATRQPLSSLDSTDVTAHVQNTRRERESMRRFLGGLLGFVLGYPVFAVVGYFAIGVLSDNHFDRDVEAVMTAAFAIGPLGAVISLIAGVIIAKPRRFQKLSVDEANR